MQIQEIVMRRGICFIFLMFLGLQAVAQRYQIFRCPDAAMVKHKNSSEWVHAVRRDSLTLFDLVRFPQKQFFAVLDHTSNKIYKSDCGGEMTIKELIDIARRDANSLVKQLKSELLNTETGKAMAYSSVGATSRGQMVFADGVEKIFCSLLGSSLRDYLEGDEQRIEENFMNNDLLVMEPVTVWSGNGADEDSNPETSDDVEVYFKLENNSDRVLCVNVLMCDTLKNKLSLCYLQDPEEETGQLIIPSGAVLEIPGQTFLLGRSYCEAPDITEGGTSENPAKGSPIFYIPFGADFIFDNWSLQNMLQTLSVVGLDQGREDYYQSCKVPRKIFIGKPIQ